MASSEPHGNEVTLSPRARLLLRLFEIIFDLKRNGNVIIFNHFKARIVWIGIVDARATETELIDLEDNGG